MIRTLRAVKPPPRFDVPPVAFTQALIQEAESSVGAWSTIDTIDLAGLPGGVDTDPSRPRPRNLTTDAATLDVGWYRVRWRDPSGAFFDGPPVPYPPAPAVISYDEARSYLGTDEEAEPSDAWLAFVIAGMSDHIQEYTGRSYLPASSGPEPRVFDHDGSQDLPIDDARDVTLVRVTGTPRDPASWVQLDDRDWIAEPSDEARKSRIRFLSDLDAANPVNRGWVFGGQPSFWRTLWPRESRAQTELYLAVEITATWGGVPDRVKLAAALWLDKLHRRDRAAFSRDMADEQTAPQPVGGLPPDVAAILDDEAGSDAGVLAV